MTFKILNNTKGSSEEIAEREDLCHTIWHLFSNKDITLCMDVLASLLIHGALSLGADKETVLKNVGAAYDEAARVHSNLEMGSKN